MEPIPLIPKIFSLVVQLECQLSSVLPLPNIHSTNDSCIAPSNTLLCGFWGKHGHNQTVCFRKVRFPIVDTRNTRIQSGKKLCTYYNKTGHTIDTCYKKHGFPPGYKTHNPTLTTQIHNLITDDLSVDNVSKEQDVKDIQLTSQQCQFLTNILC